MSEDDRPFRSILTFGSGSGSPRPELVSNVRAHLGALTVDIPLGVQAAFAEIPHDMSGGSDWIFIVDGLITQCAAELFAADCILASKFALLTIFHHARAVYQAHALAYWMFQDFDVRWRRVMKFNIRERSRFESAAKSSLGAIPSDVAEEGRRLLEDTSVEFHPTMFDMIKGNPDLEFDHAVFWKFASAHVHPGQIGSARVDSENEREMIEQLLGGLLRHGCGTFREITTAFEIRDRPYLAQLAQAEAYASYK